METIDTLVISDTSCLIHLSRVGLLAILPAVYEEVCVTPTVAAEFGDPLPSGFRILAPLHLSAASAHLDAGELSAIALAQEHPGSRLLVDEQLARAYAKSIGLKTTGTLGVLLKAKRQGLIDKIAPIIGRMRLLGFWLSDAVIREVLREANEGDG